MPGEPVPIRPLGDPEAIPVFNCVVYVSPPDDQGSHSARSAVVAGMTARGGSPREALQRLTADFKRWAAERHAAGEPVELLDPPLPREADEQEFFVPVHL